MQREQQEAIIIFSESEKYSSDELKNVLSKFCKENNIKIMDIVNFSNEFDYYDNQRLLKLMRYCSKSTMIVTNKSMLNIIPLLIIWSIFEALNIMELNDIVNSLLNYYKKSYKKSFYEEKEFRLLSLKELHDISNCLETVRYTLKQLMSNPQNNIL